MNHKEGTTHTQEGAAVTEFILTIFRANGRLLRAGDRMARDLGLTAARWQVLGAIEHAPKTVAQIARDYELTRQGILWVVQSMVRDNLVTLIKNPDHRRAKLVQFTDHGRETYAEISRRQRLWSNGLAESFKLGELTSGLASVRRLGELAMGGDDEDED